jgi:two-component system, NtrC family, nitrogen regulation sensor histidine kinase NtrY
LKMQEVSVSATLDNAISLFDSYANVKIDKEYQSPGRFWVQGDPEQINRLFINILSNAVQAGTPERELWIRIGISQEANNWSIQIADNGKGIDEDIRDKIFAPNFTTRSSGMGLGLAIAQSIAHNLGGNITFVSKTGVGTTFSITLPVYLKECV